VAWPGILGADVFAPFSGTVLEVDRRTHAEGGTGKVTIVDDRGRFIVFRHLRNISDHLVEGEPVSRGESVGEVSNVGVPLINGRRPVHLHLEVGFLHNSTHGTGVHFLDPYDFIAYSDRLGYEQNVDDVSGFPTTLTSIQAPKLCKPASEWEEEEEEEEYRDPLVINLDGNGIQTLGLDAGIYFDHDGNGFQELTGFVAPGSGFLVLDNNSVDGVQDGRELFGDFTLLPNGMLAANGFQALAQYDSNHDGKIDADDPIWSSLRICQWQFDALSEDDLAGMTEIITSLDDLGITAIYLNSTIADRIDPAGNTELRSGHFEWRDGRTGVISEYRFQRATMNPVAAERLSVPFEIALLPNLPGSGNVYDLHQAIVRDSSGQLKALLQSFAAETSPTNRAAILEQLIFKWTGADLISPSARGPFMDGREIVTLEKFYGESRNNPTERLATSWKNTYRELFEFCYAGLMAQTHLAHLYAQIAYPWDEAKDDYIIDISRLIPVLQQSLAASPEEGKQLLSEFARTRRGMGYFSENCFLSLRETFIQQDPSLGWVFDTGGRPIYEHLHQGTRSWSPHIEGTDNADAIRGSLTEGDGYLNGLNGNDVIYGTDRNEYLFNEKGDALLVGGGGNDTIHAGMGDDILDGGTGNDWLAGEHGNDTYIFRRGSGQDTICDADSSGTNTDTIWLGSNLTPDDIKLKRVGTNLVLSIIGTSDTLTVKDFFRGFAGIFRIERIQFMDGTVWTETDMFAKANVPTDGDDELYGTPGADIISMNSGNDTVYGRPGDDSLLGDEGNDKLFGEEGNDYLGGGTGDDMLIGGAGDDGLDGGTGNDSLDGGDGNDTYRFGWGYGQDTITDLDATAGNHDILKVFGAGILASGTILERLGNDLKLTIKGIGDSITVKNWLQNDTPTYGIEEIRLPDGTVWDTTAIQDLLITATDGNDTITGFSRSETITGLAGDDTIYARGGDDTLEGGAGTDKLYGEAGNDTLRGGEGNDTLSGGTADDVLDGGAGNDTLYGGAAINNWWYQDDNNGNDTYLFGCGSGQDTVYDHDKAAGNTDTILLANDLTPGDVSVRRVGDNLVLSIIGTTDTLTVTNWFWNDSAEYRVERIQFGDGTFWDVDAIKQKVNQLTTAGGTAIGYSGDDILEGNIGADKLYGRQGDDVLDGGDGDDFLYGEAGNDTLRGKGGRDRLYGGVGDDVLDGGTGNDYLYGGTANPTLDAQASNGNDTYRFSRGSGQDTIFDYDKTVGNLDTILLAADLTTADITLHRNGDNLELTINGTTDKLTVQSWFLNDSYEYQVEQIKFADGTTWDAAYME